MANARSRFDTICEYLVRSHGVSLGLIYSKPAALIDDVAFIAFYQGAMAFRLHGRALDHARALPGARPWDPLHPEKPDGPWLILGAQNVMRWDRLALDAMRCAQERAVLGAKAAVPPPALPDPDERTTRGTSFASRFSSAIASKFAEWKISR